MGSRAFSAPGKALLAGGYLVLDPQYESYVIALSSRMHSIVDYSESEQMTIKVISSQFNNDTWEYCFPKGSSHAYVPRELNERCNPFIEKTISNVLTFFAKDHNKNYSITINIFSDSGFHSEDDSKVLTSGAKQFNFHTKTITQVPKTGLGSSACLVTVLTAALASIFATQSFHVGEEETLLLIHNLAQVSHCQAQGKVGSGFDVAAATFGSILYKRFPAELINNLPSLEDSKTKYCEELINLVQNTDWNFAHDRINLPKGLKLIMGDVKTGSETTKLVGKVKSWYSKTLPESLKVYQEINEGNVNFINALAELNKISVKSPKEYTAIIKEIDDGEIKNEILLDVVNAVLQIRSNFRKISKEASADIEPPVQTDLLNSFIEQKGVLTAMIPGAGGYDAISIIATENCKINESSDSAFKDVTFLDLKQENLGLLEENPSAYEVFS